MQTIEGLTPSVLWTTVYGVIAICAVFLVVYKVYDAIHTINERKQKQREINRPDFAEEVSQKVIEKLEPRFEEIEKNLDKDKNRLNNHEFIISRIQENQLDTRNGLVVICKCLMAMAQGGRTEENNGSMDKVITEMTQYLATKIGG